MKAGDIVYYKGKTPPLRRGEKYKIKRIDEFLIHIDGVVGGAFNRYEFTKIPPRKKILYMW